MLTLNQINEFRDFLTRACAHYEKTAPTVAAYLDDLYIRTTAAPDDVRLSEIVAAVILYQDEQWELPNYAANRFYKLADRLGRDTTGLAGF